MSNMRCESMWLVGECAVVGRFYSDCSRRLAKGGLPTRRRLTTCPTEQRGNQSAGDKITSGTGSSRLFAMVSMVLWAAVAMHGQSFPSGSTGVDGNLIVNTPGVTVFTTPPVGGGSVYNFNTIQIAAGSTLKLSGLPFSTPLYFLAQGPVTVAGTIDLSGANGSQPGAPVQNSGFTVPGPGGYGGGTGVFAGGPALPGLGPAGGNSYPNCFFGGNGGGFTGDVFLVPLVGGSGGGGGYDSGGAGGGAILIASSVSITVTGTITANGGSTSPAFNPNGSYAQGGAGAGGGIRLVAPSIAGTGTISAAGGTGFPDNPGCNYGASGIVRLEAFQQTFTGTFSGTTYYLATPANLFVPTATTQPSIMVTSIGGVAVPANPTGSFTVPDVVLNSSSPLTVNVQATNIPVGTTASLYFTNESFPLQTVISSPLAGTAASSTATATVTLHPGYSEGYVIATWTQ